LIAVAVLALAGAAAALRPEPAAAPQERAIEVSVRRDEMTPAEIRLHEGDTAILHVTADREIELHVHCYDLGRDLNPGERTEIRFEATLTGRFEIEDEPTETGLGALVVQPREGGE